MAKRPKGSYTEFLTLSSRDLRELGEARLRRITTKLNDAANKRMKRIIKAGLGVLSPAVRRRGGEVFKLPKLQTFEEWQNKPLFGQSVVRKEGMTDAQYLEAQEKAYLEYRFGSMKNSYALARNFLQSDATGSIQGVLDYNERFSDVYKNVLGFELTSPQAFDKRYKKRKVLKKSVQKKLSDFWRKYEEWRGIVEKENPSEAGDTNINSVEKFFEEVYTKGKTDYEDMQELARSQYLEAEQAAREGELNDESPQSSVPTAPVERRGTKEVKQPKYTPKGKKKEWSPKLRFEKIKIF